MRKSLVRVVHVALLWLAWHRLPQRTHNRKRMRAVRTQPHPPPRARCPGALGFWLGCRGPSGFSRYGRALATGTAWAGLCLIHHHQRCEPSQPRGPRDRTDWPIRPEPSGWNGGPEQVDRRTRMGGTAGQHGWNGGPARVERRRTSTGGSADQHGWNGGPERVERRTRTGGTADHEGVTADRQV